MFDKENMRFGFSSRALRMLWVLATAVTVIVVAPFFLVWGCLKGLATGLLLTATGLIDLCSTNWGK